jgi:hypothetical protein
MAELRKCIGSARFGIEPHDAPVEDFPKQPSQKDGLGRMCRPHWNQYTTALRMAATTSKADDRPPEQVQAKPSRRRVTPPKPVVENEQIDRA